jgi:hypothetical protein
VGPGLHQARLRGTAVIRRCDGTDPNLTRQVPQATFDAASPPVTISRPWAFRAEPGHVVICCQCGKVFDDVNRMVTYPHEAF